MKIGDIARVSVVIGTLLAGSATMGGTTYKVWTNGVPAIPYDTWETAFTNIQNAIDYAAAGDQVLVTNGTYGVGQAIRIGKGVAVKSAQGPGATTISLIRSASPSAVVMVTFSNAVLDGFTVMNGSNSPSGNGGGVYVSNTGTVQNCVIVSNTAAFGGGAYVCTNGILKNCQIAYNVFNTQGGGVFLAAGTVYACVIASNAVVADAYGGGIYMANAASVVRNCLIQGNSATRPGGGINMAAGLGLVENCTVAGNLTSGIYGGGIFQAGGTVRNTIVWHNSGYWHGFPNWYKTAGVAEFSCSEDAPSGVSNLTANARFVNPQAGDYRLSPDSPCRNAATNLAWFSGALDLAGVPRSQEGAPDMGAFEFSTGRLQCAFWPDKVKGFNPCTVVLTAAVDGTNTDSLYYRWDVDNNGSVDQEGADIRVVTNSYGNGFWTPALTVSNAAGEVASQARWNLIRVGPQAMYVVMTNALALAPFTNWATAGTNIQTAANLGVDGSTVWVSNGTYNSQTILLTNGVIVRGVNGATATVVKALSTVINAFGIGLQIVRDQGTNPGAVIQG